MTEQELWEGIRQSDESAFTQVFDKFHATLYNYGRKLCDDSGLVEDAVQEVFIDIRRLRKNLTPYFFPSSFTSTAPCVAEFIWEP